MLQFIQPAYHALVRAAKAIYRRAAVIVGMLLYHATMIFASSTGAGGFTKATTEISSYQTPVSNLMKAIAAVIVLVGAFNVYFKMQNGEEDHHDDHRWLRRVYRHVGGPAIVLQVETADGMVSGQVPDTFPAHE